MDELDRAQASTGVYEAAALQSHRARQQYSGGIPALRGFCEDCCKPIPLARIKAKPDAVRCIGCQMIFENEP